MLYIKIFFYVITRWIFIIKLYIKTFASKFLEKYTGNKLGERVIKRLGEQTLKEGIFLLRLDCNSANDKLCNYYEKQGFIKVREKQMPDSLNNLYEKRLDNNEVDENQMVHKIHTTS